ncbi:MAG: hypothetical protein M3Y83_01400 [Actinomycetota bacterium]|nr:hypothetical protein [Actinomycetota bacterium]
MPEVELGFPRTFVEFSNPDDDTEVFRCDLTWLTSRWTCIFGQGCPGIYETSPDAGCCTLGAHFADKDDEKRVAAVVKQLTPEVWERHAEGRRRWTETDDDGDRKTRALDGACIFHNSRDFAGGYGCALHGHALSTGVEPHTVKPDVCWQLPLRRQFREVDRGDGTEYTEVSIGEYTRAGWGPGGADLDWYCSSNTEAHVGAAPVYISNRAELTALMGERGYAILAEHCANFDRGGPNTPHPASPHR